MKKLFASIALLLLMAGSAFALSDAEYLRMKKNNADFARADKRLTQVWNKLKAPLSKRAFSELQRKHILWLQATEQMICLTLLMI